MVVVLLTIVIPFAASGCYQLLGLQTYTLCDVDGAGGGCSGFGGSPPDASDG